MQGRCYEIANRTVCFESDYPSLLDVAEATLTEWTVVKPIVHSDNTPHAVIRLYPSRETPVFSAKPESFEIYPGLICRTDGAEFFFQSDFFLVRFGSVRPVVVDVWMNEAAVGQRSFQLAIVPALLVSLRRCGRFDLHAASVINPKNDRSAVFIAASNHGKSTLALLLASRGWQYLSDDNVLLEETVDGVRLWAVRRGFGLRKHAVAQLAVPGLERAAGRDFHGAETKRRFAPEALFPEGYVEAHQAHALFFPKITDAPQTEIKKLAASETMRRLLRVCPWAAYDQPVAAKYLAALKRLANTCAAYDLFSGRDLLDPRRADQLFTNHV